VPSIEIITGKSDYQLNQVEDRQKRKDRDMEIGTAAKRRSEMWI
jgi:hypothetical protein